MSHEVGSYTPDNPLNFCRGCNRDYASLTAFDQHRLNRESEHRFSPEHPNGRRCMDIEEMGEDFELDPRGRWRIKMPNAERERLAELSSP